jgi:2-phospho-L-lactate/phosphoenolpyruvate guanylyltransferase
MLRAMRVLAVPVKSLERAKSRLAPVLSPAERAALTLIMFQDVLEACVVQQDWETWVVSRDEAILEVGVRQGARALVENGTSLLDAIRQAESELLSPSSALCVVLADLPLVTAEAISQAVGSAGGSAVVAAPASSDGGTNLLYRRPPSVIPARFGRSSFAKHRWAARKARVPFEEVRLPELNFDLDRPEDLTRVIADGGARRTRSACLEMGVPERLRVQALGR